MEELPWVWLVMMELDDGTKYREFVLARTGGDACVILGNRIRAEHGLEPGGHLGTISVEFHRVDDGARRHAVNPDGPFTVG